MLIKTKAGALQYAIFVSVVIALLIVAFISVAYLQEKLRVKTSFFQETVNHTYQSFDYLAYTEIPYQQQTTLPPTENTSIIATAFKTHWGVFDLVNITTKKKKEVFTKTGLLGGRQLQRPALYLQDQHQPLVVVGDTRIEGTAYLPEQGVKRGSIAGHAYTNPQLIYGNMVRSQQKLPLFQQRAYLEKLGTNIHLENGQNIHVELQESAEISNTFSQPTKVINSSQDIDLEFITLRGNIIVQSGNKITIHPSAILTDILLLAPEIDIKDGVTGNFQAIATQKITVGKNCKLHYPTALVVTEKENQRNTSQGKESNQISIQQKSDIRGIVAFLSKNNTENYQAQILVEEHTTIIGEVYCNQNIELRGTVKGSVYTNAFIARQFGAVYKNHLYNGKIVANDIPTHYGGLSFKETQPTIVKWLNY